MTSPPRIRLGTVAVLYADPEHEEFRVVDIDRLNYTARLATEGEYRAGAWPKRPELLWEWLSFRT